jgi:hypothetical protein
MKPILNWIKENLLIVVCSVVAVAAFPALYVMGSGKNTALIESVSSEISGDERALQQLGVTYTIPTLDPATPQIEFSRVPNQATTDAVIRAIEKVQEESREMLRTATEFNKDSKTLLMQGLFPEPTSAELPLRQRFGSLWVPVHAQLLQRINAGLPPEATEVRTVVLQKSNAAREDLLAGRENDQLSSQDVEQLVHMGSEERLRIYRDRAMGIGVYASGEIFKGVVAPNPTRPPTIPMIWDMQHRYWVHETVLNAIVTANTNSLNGLLLAVPEAPVKRILSIKADDWNLAFAPEVSGSEPLDSLFPADYEASITGRNAWPSFPNSLYDIRYVELALHVRSDAVPAIVDALSSTNLMTVVGCSLAEVDSQTLLESGYYYGGGHVMEMKVRLETLWLRPWTTETMPENIKLALGVPVENSDDSTLENDDQY